MIIRVSSVLLVTFGTLSFSCSENVPIPSDPMRSPEADPRELAQRYVSEGERFADEAKFEEAVASFAKASEIHQATGDWARYVRCLSEMGEQSRRAAEPDRAMAYLDEALKAGLTHLGERHVEIASVWDRTASVHNDQGDYLEAIRSYTKALEIRLALLGEDHPDVGATYAGRANAHRNLGDFVKALADSKSALAIQVAARGDHHPEVAWTYNILGAVYSDKGEYEEAFALYEKALAILQGATGYQAVRLARVHSNLGVQYDEKGDYDRALESYEKALSLQIAVLGQGHTELAGTYNNMGTVYVVKGDYDRARASYEKAVAIYLAAGRTEHPHLAYMYDNLGFLYLKKRDYDQAVTFLNKSLSVFRAALGERHPEMSAAYTNLGLLYEETGDYDEAIACHKKALAIEIESQGPRHTNVASSYNNMGAVYARKGDRHEAIALYEKALDVRLEALGARHPDVASIHRNLGNLYQLTGNLESAIAHHEKALAIFQTSFGEHHPEMAQSSNDLGDVYRARGDGGKALSFFERAIRANVPSSSAGSPGRAALSESILLDSLDRKASVLAVRGRSDLRAAVSTFQDASSVMDKILSGYRAEESKLVLAERASGIYERAIRAALELYNETGDPQDQEAAFRFAEKSKSGILLDALSEAEARQFAGIPDALLAEERTLRTDLSFYERSLTEEELHGEKADTAKVALWQDKVFSLKQAYDGLLKRLEMEYPDYYRLKYQVETVSLSDVQKGLLDDHTALVEYFTGADAIFTFIVTKESFIAKASPKSPLFERQIEDIRLGIINQDFARYAEAARGLYETLLSPFAGQLTGRSLIIIPDGALSSVPFEALLTEGGRSDYAKLPYLLEEHAVAYGYSATLLKQSRTGARREAKRDFVGFAPIFADGLPAGTRGGDFFEASLARDSVRGDARLRAHLPATRTEVTSILNRFQGSYGVLNRVFGRKSRIWLGPDAREGNLKSGDLADYRFVHFATHGLVNEKTPRLSGLVLAPEGSSEEDGVLHLGEIYNLELNADLVVLSACETGLGRVARGEGIIGLTRGFLYAGASNVLVSLWQVSDVTTSDLMVDFYDEMLGGTTKLEALRDAKLKLIRRNPEYAKPYYWAPFILIGK